MPPTAPRLSADDVATMATHVDVRFHNTPLVEFDPLSRTVGARVLLKVETLNPIRCFKGRGASVFVALHARRSPDTPIVTASAGNWGQALALAGRTTSTDVTVFAAQNANPSKLARMRDLGAEVRLAGDDFDAAKLAARDHAVSSGARFAEDGKHRSVTAGHGSCAMELADTVDIDAVLVPLGNGALVNGMGTWLQSAMPHTEVVAVSAAGAPAMHQSFMANACVETPAVDTIADGLAVRTPVPEAVDDMIHAVDASTLVTDPQMAAAQALILDHAGLVTEPSGAAGLAALLAEPQRWADRTVVVVVTGSNVPVT